MFKILESPNKKEDMTNLHRYYKDRKDDINSSIMELACDLAAARLMNEHAQPFEAFIEPDDPDDPEGGTHYKKEFQDEFDRYYDEQYDRIARLMKFDLNADDGVAHDNAAGSSEETEASLPDTLEFIERHGPDSTPDEKNIEEFREWIAPGKKQSKKKELYAFVWPCVLMERNVSDQGILAAYETEDGVEKLTPDELAAEINDGDCPFGQCYVRFIETE